MTLDGAEGDGGKWTRQREKLAVEPFFLRRTVRIHGSKIRSKPVRLKKAQMEWALAQMPALQPTFCVNAHCERLTPTRARQRTLRPESTCSLQPQLGSGRRQDLRGPEPGQGRTLDPEGELSKSYPQMQAGCPGERERASCCWRGAASAGRWRQASVPDVRGPLGPCQMLLPF